MIKNIARDFLSNNANFSIESRGRCGAVTGSASDFISNLFNKGSMGSSSSTGMGSGSDSCGNNTSIMCAGDVWPPSV